MEQSHYDDLIEKKKNCMRLWIFYRDKKNLALDDGDETGADFYTLKCVQTLKKMQRIQHEMDKDVREKAKRRSNRRVL